VHFLVPLIIVRFKNNFENQGKQELKVYKVKKYTFPKIIYPKGMPTTLKNSDTFFLVILRAASTGKYRTICHFPPQNCTITILHANNKVGLLEIRIALTAIQLLQ
jgi:hypothetical protein